MASVSCMSLKVKVFVLVEEGAHIEAVFFIGAACS